MTSLYDGVSRCATRCHLCHVTVEMSHLRQVKISAGDDSEDWLVVSDSSQDCPLLTGDRSVSQLNIIIYSFLFTIKVATKIIITVEKNRTT